LGVLVDEHVDAAKLKSGTILGDRPGEQPVAASDVQHPESDREALGEKGRKHAAAAPVDVASLNAVDEAHEQIGASRRGSLCPPPGGPDMSSGGLAPTK
jgi:hypothetical protein